MEPYRILLIDDHPMMRSALRFAFENELDFQVVGEAGSLEQGKQLALELEPDLITVDLYLPDGSGIDMILYRNAEVPKARILVVTSSSSEADIIAAVEAGTESYIVKDAPADQLLQAARGVLEQGSFLTQGAASILLRRMRQGKTEVSQPEPLLSDREQEIIALLANGATNAEIASSMWITESTVRTHLQRILRKLKISNRAQLVVYAVKHQN